jgi:hypothetical protein
MNCLAIYTEWVVFSGCYTRLGSFSSHFTCYTRLGSLISQSGMVFGIHDGLGNFIFLEVFDMEW